MKKVFLALMCLVLLLGCKKDENKTGTLEVTVSYFYNDFQGYKPDVGATVYLFKQTRKSIDYENSTPRVGIIQYEGDDKSTIRDFTADTDVSGKATIGNIPYGDYLILVASKGRFSYSIKPITVNSELTTEVKNFGHRHEFNKTGEPW